MQREMTDEERQWVKTQQAEVDRKIAAGILPKGAEVAICLTVGCQHWTHSLEKPFQKVEDLK